MSCAAAEGHGGNMNLAHMKHKSSSWHLQSHSAGCHRPQGISDPAAAACSGADWLCCSIRYLAFHQLQLLEDALVATICSCTPCCCQPYTYYKQQSLPTLSPALPMPRHTTTSSCITAAILRYYHSNQQHIPLTTHHLQLLTQLRCRHYQVHRPGS